MSDHKGSMGSGIAAGAVAALVAAVLWAVLADVTGYQIGFAAVGVGALVGLAVGRCGAGRANGPLPIVAAVIGLLAAVVGDFLIIAVSIGHAAADLGITELDSTLEAAKAMLQGDISLSDAYSEYFKPINLLFYVLSAGAAFRVTAALLLDRERTNVPAPTSQPDLWL